LNKLDERWRILLLAGATAVVYGNTLGNGFAMDDFLYIFGNPAVTSPTLKSLFSATRAFNVFRPVTFATLALNYRIGGDHAWSYHLVNLLLHAGVTVLLYLVLRRLLDKVSEGEMIAWIAALLFAVHPLHTEAVTSVVGRSELLAAGFLLAAWLLYMREWIIPAVVCVFVGMLAKESAVVFLPLVIIGDFVREEVNAGALRRYSVIAGVTIGYLWILRKAQGGRFGEKSVNFLDNPLAQLPAGMRILNALRISWKYVGLHVYPATLSCDYSYNAITLYSGWRHAIPAVFAWLAVLSAIFWAGWKGRRDWILGAGIYVAAFAATANILLPTGTIMGERLAYLPSAGFCLIASVVLIRFLTQERAMLWGVLLTLVLALSARTVARNRDWRDGFSLFSAAVGTVPGSSKAHAGLAKEYLLRDDLLNAEKEFQISFRIYPDTIESMDAYGVVESRLGHDEKALELMKDAVSMTDKNDSKYDFEAVTLAAQLLKMGRNDEALNILNEVISTSPNYSRAWSNRAAVHFTRGERQTAANDAEMALRLDEANDQARNLLAMLDRPVVAPGTVVSQ
jgi:protein O-mannosyl-transferase